MLSDGRRIATRTLISTVPSSPNPIVEQLGLPIARGRLECDATMAVKGCEGVWAVGDCALIPMPGGEPCPPTAQHAIRQAKLLAGNILASHTGAPLRSFAFTGLGKLGALGHHRAVAELPGGVRVAGLPAWLMWRGIYWSKLPGATRKTRVAISWLSDLVLPAHPVQLNLGGGHGATQAHYEPGETVFDEGDTGDSLYMILAGRVEVLKRFGSRAAGHRHARAGRVLRRDGAAWATSAQREHAGADRARPAGAARVGLLRARGRPHGVPQRVRGDRARASAADAARAASEPPA